MTSGFSKSESIWLCLSCDTCHSRCPQTINTPKVMYFLREEAVRLGLAHPKSKDAQAFHKAFLGSIARHGRLHEIGMLMNYKAAHRPSAPGYDPGLQALSEGQTGVAAPRDRGQGGSEAHVPAQYWR
ncbi:MAG: hypothetical protein V9G09_02360 [Candidatus Nanopelagicales bacterium]